MDGMNETEFADPGCLEPRRSTAYVPTYLSTHVNYNKSIKKLDTTRWLLFSQGHVKAALSGLE